MLAIRFLLIALLAAHTSGFVAVRRAHRGVGTLRMVTFDGPDDAKNLARTCIEESCNPYERDAVVKELLRTKKELKAEILKLDAVLKDLGHIDDEDNFINFVAAGAARIFGMAPDNGIPPARTDGYPTGYSEKPGKAKTFFKLDWDFAKPSFTKEDKDE